MTKEFLFVAIAFALADAEEPERTVVEEAHQLNLELEELLTHLRSLPAPTQAPVQDIESNETEPSDAAPITAETTATVSSQF